MTACRAGQSHNHPRAPGRRAFVCARVSASDQYIGCKRVQAGAFARTPSKPHRCLSGEGGITGRCRGERSAPGKQRQTWTGPCKSTCSTCCRPCRPSCCQLAACSRDATMGSGDATMGSGGEAALGEASALLRAVALVAGQGTLRAQQSLSAAMVCVRAALRTRGLRCSSRRPQLGPRASPFCSLAKVI